ncbi:MAG: hypothetical protein J6A89_06975 [Clostridia bacterium]|nr:hypothetical protein [Clostridia bacterium]
MSKSNVKIGLPLTKSIIYFLIVYYIAVVILTMIISLLLFKFVNPDNIVLPIIISSICAVFALIISTKFFSRKYIVSAEKNEFANKITMVLMIFYILSIVLGSVSGYKELYTKIISLEFLQSAYENNYNIEPFNENCKTNEDSIAAINEYKQDVIFEYCTMPIIGKSIIFIIEIITTHRYVKRRLCNENFQEI